MKGEEKPARVKNVLRSDALEVVFIYSRVRVTKRFIWAYHTWTTKVPEVKGVDQASDWRTQGHDYK